jgi:hypothetical protein
MFVINEDLSIYITRGDIALFNVSAENDGEPYVFKVGDIVRIKVFGKKDCETVVLQKDFPVTTAGEQVEIFLTNQDTLIGDVISKHKDYWYEIELNPDSNPQTIIGYDGDGAKVFRLVPEGRNLDKSETEVKPEDIPIIDAQLDVTSLRPVENQAIVRGIELTAQRVTNELSVTIEENVSKLQAEIDTLESTVQANKEEASGNLSGSISTLDAKVEAYKEAMTTNFSHGIDTLENMITTKNQEVSARIDTLNEQHSETGQKIALAEEEIYNLGSRLYAQKRLLWEGELGDGEEITVEQAGMHDIFRVILDGTDNLGIIMTRSVSRLNDENKIETVLQGSYDRIIRSQDEEREHFTEYTTFIRIIATSTVDFDETWHLEAIGLQREDTGEVNAVGTPTIVKIFSVV